MTKVFTNRVVLYKMVKGDLVDYWEAYAAFNLKDGYTKSYS